MSYLFWAVIAPPLCPCLPISLFLHQPPCYPSLPLSPSCCWCCKSKIAIPQHNLDINTSALDDFCPSLLSRGGVYSQLVGVLSPPTSYCSQGVVGGCRSPFVVGLLIPPHLLHGLPLHSLLSVVLPQGSGGGGIGYSCVLNSSAIRMGVSHCFGRVNCERVWRIPVHESIKGILGSGGCILRVHQAVLQ
jgi:hypothetical protein